MNKTKKQPATHPVTANALKDALWKTLLDVRNKKANPATANAVAKQAREIINIVRMELTVAKMSNTKPSRHLISFSHGDTTTENTAR